MAWISHWLDGWGSLPSPNLSRIEEFIDYTTQNSSSITDWSHRLEIALLWRAANQMGVPPSNLSDLTNIIDGWVGEHPHYDLLLDKFGFSISAPAYNNEFNVQNSGYDWEWAHRLMLDMPPPSISLEGSTGKDLTHRVYWMKDFGFQSSYDSQCETAINNLIQSLNPFDWEMIGESLLALQALDTSTPQVLENSYNSWYDLPWNNWESGYHSHLLGALLYAIRN